MVVVVVVMVVVVVVTTTDNCIARVAHKRPARCCIASTFDFCRHGSFTLGRA